MGLTSVYHALFCHMTGRLANQVAILERDVEHKPDHVYSNTLFNYALVYSFFIAARIVCGGFVFGPYFSCYLSALSRFAITSLRKRELVSLL